MTEIYGIENHDNYDAESSVTDKKVVQILLKRQLKPKAIIKMVKPIKPLIIAHDIDTRSELSDLLNESYLETEDDLSAISETQKQTLTKTNKPQKTSIRPVQKLSASKISKISSTSRATKSKPATEPPKVISKENTYSRWIFGEQLLISTEDNTYIYDPKDLSLIGKVLDESNIEWY